MGSRGPVTSYPMRRHGVASCLGNHHGQTSSASYRHSCLWLHLQPGGGTLPLT